MQNAFVEYLNTQIAGFKAKHQEYLLAADAITDPEDIELKESYELSAANVWTIACELGNVLIAYNRREAGQPIIAVQPAVHFHDCPMGLL